MKLTDIKVWNVDNAVMVDLNEHFLRPFNNRIVYQVDDILIDFKDRATMHLLLNLWIIINKYNETL